MIERERHKSKMTVMRGKTRENKQIIEIEEQRNDSDERDNKGERTGKEGQK